MRIEKIKIKNFYSFKDVTINLGEYEGLTVIKGINKDAKGSNGSGKSALVEAVLFGLTGKTIRKSTEDSMLHNKAKKNCCVELHITNDNDYIVITRNKKPTKLELLVGDNNLTGANVFETQNNIDELLNTNYKVLVSSMFFGQSNDISFLDSSADDKRTIIKTFLNLEDMFSMRDRIKGHKSEAYQGMKLQDSIIKEHERTVANLNKKIKIIDKDRKKYTDKYDEYALSLSLEDILRAEKDDRLTDQTILGYIKELNALKDREENLKEKLEGKQFICDKCGQDLPDLPEEELKDELGFCRSAIRETVRRKKDLKDNQIPLPISSNEYSKVLEYKNLCRDEDTFKDLLEESNKKVQECNKGKSENKIRYDVMRFWEKALSEQGVIKYIIKNVLDYFNDKCNFYLSYLTNSKYFVEFDEELAEKIATNGTIIQYISLSGGEKRKINLAVMLALKDLLLLTDKNQSDLVFFDEVAENLDEEGVKGLYELFQEIKKNKTIFVITHNKYLKTLLDSAKRLTLIKNKGVTSLVKK